MSIFALRADRRLVHRMIGGVRTQTCMRSLPAIAIADARRHKARVRRQTYDRRRPRLRLFSCADPAETAIAELRTLRGCRDTPFYRCE
jgi:hypothetical protein